MFPRTSSPLVLRSLGEGGSVPIRSNPYKSAQKGA